jgi:hypothetical protein
MKAVKRRPYEVLLKMDQTTTQLNEIRILRKYPTIPWTRVWKNLHAARLPDTITSMWYAAIHDIIPTHERLAAIHLVPNETCQRCGAQDTLQHRITECEEGPVIWNWTRTRFAALLRMHPQYILDKWTLRPISHYSLAQKQVAVIWIMAHLVAYRLQTQRRLSLIDYMDFLKRA